MWEVHTQQSQWYEIKIKIGNLRIIRKIFSLVCDVWLLGFWKWKSIPRPLGSEKETKFGMTEWQKKRKAIWNIDSISFPLLLSRVILSIFISAFYSHNLCPNHWAFYCFFSTFEITWNLDIREERECEFGEGEGAKGNTIKAIFGPFSISTHFCHFKIILVFIPKAKIFIRFR